jgi:hypothetical protein
MTWWCSRIPFPEGNTSLSSRGLIWKAMFWSLAPISFAQTRRANLPMGSALADHSARRFRVQIHGQIAPA